jgi:Flp pilus assembly protein TadD
MEMGITNHGTRWRLAVCGVVAAFAASGCASMSAAGALARYQRDALEAKYAADQFEEEPKTLEDRLRSGDRELDQGEIERAMMNYLEAVRLDPAASLPREKIGYVQLGHDPAQAQVIFSGLVEMHPERSSAWRGLGLSLLGMGEMDRAELAFEQALKLDPESPESHYNMAVVTSLLGRTEAALVHNLRAMELKPRDATFANGLGVSQLLLGNFGLAESAFRRAVSLDPRIPAYANNLGLSLGRRERYAEALDMFRRHGSEQAALNNLGYVYFSNGLYREAALHYERALGRDGDQKAQILENLGTSLAQVDTQPGPTSPLR